MILGFELFFVKICCGSFYQKKLLSVLVRSQGKMQVKITRKSNFCLKIVQVLVMIPYFMFVVGPGKWGYLAVKNLEFHQLLFV